MYDQIVRQLLPAVEFHQNRYARELDTAVFPGCHWLDIGAGARIHGGWLGPSQEELVARARFVCGCDFVADHVAANPHLTARVVADARCLPFHDNSFGLVTANMVLEHLSEPVSVFAEVRRVLKPGGRFAFVTPNRRHPAVWTLSVLIPPALRSLLARWIEGRAPEHVFRTYYGANTRDEIRSLAVASGLQAKHVTVFSSYPVLRRPWPLTLLEAMWMRCLPRQLSREFGSNLVGTLEKPSG